MAPDTRASGGYANANANALQLLAAVEEYGGPEGFVREDGDMWSYTGLCRDFSSLPHMRLPLQTDASPR